MRIIRGKYQRRIIHVPPGLPVRPTTDMAKESLFNILGNLIDFEGMRALDLFAGTGNISYELVSRGCGSVTAVDDNFKCVQFINKTAELLNMDKLQAIRTDAFRFLAMQRLPFNVIFADPPYDLLAADYHKLLALIVDKKLLHENGILIIEHSRGIDFSEHSYFMEQRNYGKVHFSFFEIPEA